MANGNDAQEAQQHHTVIAIYRTGRQERWENCDEPRRFSADPRPFYVFTCYKFSATEQHNIEADAVAHIYWYPVRKGK